MSDVTARVDRLHSVYCLDEMHGYYSMQCDTIDHNCEIMIHAVRL